MRHGEAANIAGGVDHERPLTERGRHQADATADQLKLMSLNLGLMVTSTARRARETGDQVQGRLGPEGPTSRDQQASFYYEGIDSLVHHLAGIDSAHTSLIAIGHNPTWSLAAQAFTGGFRGLKTGECLVLSSEAETWQDAMTSSQWHLDAHLSPQI